MEGEQEDLNLDKVSLSALSFSTTEIIARALNRKKVLPTEEGLPRDSRGLAHLTGLAHPTGDDPTSQLLKSWKKEPSSSLGLLIKHLCRLDRWDIVDDCYHLIREDAKKFISKTLQTSYRNEELEKSIQKQILTHDDAKRLENGLPLLTYDAFLLHADQDQSLADDMAEELEHLLLCHKDDLIGGFMYQHHGWMELIKERCHHVVVIVTEHLLRSPMNQFLIAFAQLVAIETEKRIIIPCLYGDNLRLPMELNLLHKLDFNRQQLKRYDFWSRLKASVSPCTITPQPLTAEEKLAITEATARIRELSNSQASSTLEQPTKVIDSHTKPFQRHGKENKKAHKSMSDIVSQCSADSSAMSCSSLTLEKTPTKTTSKFIKKIKKTFKFSRTKRVAVEA